MPLGYKVMALEGRQFVSLANDTFRIPAKIGTVVRMPHPGLFMGSTEQFVLDYYTGLTDETEVLVTFKFARGEVTRDSGDEIAATSARVLRWRVV